MICFGSTKQEIGASSLDLAPSMIRSLFNELIRDSRPYVCECAHETPLVHIKWIRFQLGGDLGAFEGLASSFSAEFERFDEFWHKMHKFATKAKAATVKL